MTIKEQILNETQTRGQELCNNRTDWAGTMTKKCVMIQSTKSIFELIKEFHKKFNLQSNPNNKELQEDRIKHLTEELNEYIKAVKSNDRIEQLDALIDLIYIALGTANYENFKFDDAFKEVHSCNMKKIQKATERSKWDVVKPEGWQPPNLKDYI